MIEVVRYSAVNDFGTVVNPMIVEGQLHGGVVQGIGQTLMEMTAYDAEGQLLTGSYMDYAMPRAVDAPNFEVANHPVPATTNPLGVKGCGEAGCAGSLTSIMNAVADALSDYGIRHIDMPATPLPRLAGDPGRRRRTRRRNKNEKPSKATMTQAVELPLPRRRAPPRPSSSGACASRISSATTTSCCWRRCSSSCARTTA